MENSQEEDIPAQIGLHSVKNILGNQQQISLFSEHDQEFAKDYGITLEGRIGRFGIDLTDMQTRVMEGILRGFSQTNYRGNISSMDVEEIVQENYGGKLPATYKNLQVVPRLRLSQSDIIELSGLNPNSIAHVARAVDAIQELGERQFCFYYDRLAFDEDGKPQKDRNGRWKKEEVVSVGSLFTIKQVRDEGSGNLKYYEIMPSPIFLDQRESYFMLVPYGWREEVKKLVGKKKASSYTFRFLLFLRYQYELKRRSNQKRPYQIRWSQDEIAIAIKMPESVYKRQKNRTRAILNDAYEVAKRLGYLDDYQVEATVDVLTLKDSKFFTQNDDSFNKALTAMSEIRGGESSEAVNLFEYFHRARRHLDPVHKEPQGKVRQTQIKELAQLLNTRSKEDIEELVSWSITQRFWCSRLSTPAKLKSTFSEAWAEMTVAKQGSSV